MIQQRKAEIPSADGKLTLHLLLVVPEGKINGIVQVSHGMAEHKERYVPFLEMLAENGYAAVIHDHRGHGDSVVTKEDYGYFYDDTGTEIVKDLYVVTQYAKEVFPGVPLYLFGHSMGTLVARNYLKLHDDAIDKLILCGAPCKNDGAKGGLLLIKRMEKHRSDRYRVQSVDKLVFGSYNRKFTESRMKNRWICSVPEVVFQYNRCPKCGFTFTLNGFENLFRLMLSCYDDTGWQVHRPRLPILFLGGGDDPVIGGGDGFLAQMDFLQKIGYPNVCGKLYGGKRHELLNEDIKEQIYQDVLSFLP
ncbi:MAG: alpha/beta fold hydrolase [Oscillospiraceae bacterium]|nr:alpha/beta fold hydrolase [Oscillospiraceae bacterium]